MKFLSFILAGLVSGLFGGMGMGGGTFLIPILNIFYKTDQHTAQFLNLFTFIPMAIFSLLFHIKNNLVQFKQGFIVIIPALIFCLIGCFVSSYVETSLLKKIFGGFLIAVAIFSIILSLKTSSKNPNP